jgi:hypothetical protein
MYPARRRLRPFSNCHSAALVSRRAINWCCFDRSHARAVFGRRWHWSHGGYFRIAAAQPYKANGNVPNQPRRPNW